MGHKRILINARSMQVDFPTGVANWVSRLVAAVETLVGEQKYAIRLISPPKSLRSAIRGHFWEQVLLPQKLKDNEILLSPANWGPVLVRRQALVVHDILPVTHPQFYSRTYSMLAKLMLPMLLQRASVILTVSNWSRNQIVKHFHVSPSKVLVVGAGVDNGGSREPSDRTRKRPYFLFVGGADKRKNFEFISRFWPDFSDSHEADLVVVCRSSHGPARSTMPEVLDQTIIVMDPSDTELHSLYRECVALLFPSFAEGFGLPLLEVLKAGRPFISTDVGVAREIALECCSVLALDETRWSSEMARYLGHEPCTHKDHDLTNWTWFAVGRRVLEACDDIKTG